MYSDISSRIIASSLPNSCLAACFANSVLPVPVVPSRRRVPRGLRLFCPPWIPLYIRRAIVRITWSCPLTTARIPSAKSTGVEDVRSRLSIGIPFLRFMTLAISFKVISDFPSIFAVAEASSIISIALSGSILSVT